MKSKRSKATDITQKVRKEVLNRDNFACIICGDNRTLTMAHYIPRSKGGLGISQNLVTMCMSCHHKIDNGKSKEVADNLTLAVKSYLHSKYAGSWNEKDLKYDKYKKEGLLWVSIVQLL